MPISNNIIFYFRLIASLLAFTFFIYILRTRYEDVWNKIIFVLKAKFWHLPFRRNKTVVIVVKKEKEESKKHIYETFDEFLQDCPKYQIDDSFLGRIIRNIYASAGAKFQQFVWIDTNSPSDSTAWIRREGEIVLHEKGTYALPTKSEKKIQYYFQNDMRPIIDLLDDPDWRNPDAVAEVVTAISNAKNMDEMKKATNTQDYSKYILIILAASVITGILMLAFMSQYDKGNKELITLLKTIIEQTKP